MYIKKSRQLGGILLVSGTTIGAGMLAMPVLTGLSGFVLAALLLVFYWVLSFCTALLTLEVNLWFTKPVNTISMSRYTLGKAGEVVSWLVYLLLLYSLTAAYLAGSGPIVSKVILSFTGYEMPKWAESLPFLAIFGSFIYVGTRAVDYVNRALMMALVIIYVALLSLAFGHMEGALLERNEISYIWAAIPVVATSFGFQIIIPSLTTYLHRDVKVLKRVVIIGSVLPLVVYLLWEFVTLGIIPVNDLKLALKEGLSATYPLTEILQTHVIHQIGGFFAFFAIVTSFLGVGLSLLHFIMDGCKIKQNIPGKILTALLTFGPPLVFVLFYPRGFIMALEYAGLLVIILLGILPVLMAWKGRKVHQGDTPYKVPGGTPLLAVLLLIFCLLFVISFWVMS